MTIAVDLGRKATIQTNKQTNKTLLMVLLPIFAFLWLLYFLHAVHHHDHNFKTNEIFNIDAYHIVRMVQCIY